MNVTKQETSHVFQNRLKPIITSESHVDLLMHLTTGTRKRADSYFPTEDRVRLVRLVSHGELPGEMSGGSIIEYFFFLGVGVSFIGNGSCTEVYLK